MISSAVLPACAMAQAPAWLMPTPWPQPVQVSVRLSFPARTVKSVEGREKSRRSSVPAIRTPPTWTLRIPPASLRSESRNQSPGSPDRSASGWASRMRPANSAAVKVCSVRYMASDSSPGLGTLTR